MDTVYVKTQNGRWHDIGRPVEMTFELNCIDPATLGLFFGEETMTFKVGQTVQGYNEYNALPVGTVLTGGYLAVHTHYIKQESGEWLHLGSPSRVVGGLASGIGYTIHFLPGQAPDPVDDVAEALWEIRNQVVSEEIGYPAPWESVKNDLPGEIYRALAEYVIENHG